MSDELEERLRNHAQSFDSLLSLIPAKLYYGEDVSDQWKRKKQTPEQRRAAKMAKLDPSNWKSAKDVMDERSAAAKRKREGEGETSADNDEQSVKPEQPKVIQDLENHKVKKRKLDINAQPQQANKSLAVDEEKQRQAIKKATKKEKAQKEKEKVQSRNARKQAEKLQREHAMDVDDDGTTLTEPIILDQRNGAHDNKADQWSTASSSEGASDVLSPPAESGSSSTSSLPPSISDHPSKPKPQSSKLEKKAQSQPITSESQPTVSQLPDQTQRQSLADREAARARLANAISSFRSARNADEPTAKKPRNRAELLEQRRQKEEAKRLAKKEQRRKEREEASRKEDEEIARRFSPGGSGSLLASPRSPPMKDEDTSVNNFSYGRIEFGDGTKVDPTLNGILDQRKKKGPQDTQTALKAAQNKASRRAGLDEQKLKEIEEKDMWLNAKRRAHGERVKDDTSLLKKALKRQESQKKKSEKEWTERKEGVATAIHMKQKKRTENLAKRKEEKQSHKVGKKGKKVIKKRPGFEGSFRGRTGGGKKKS